MTSFLVLIILIISNHLTFQGVNLPLVYMLLGNKTEATYQLAFDFIKSKVPSSPKIINVDFEKACINALARVWPDSVIAGCYFHFTQAIRRKVDLID